jgi:prepilin-type N-terminal cleavage/methylation domain-containing protein
MNQKGFTLIELLVVITIIGLLAAITVIMVNQARSKSRDTIRKDSLNRLKTALELYYTNNQAYPCSGPGGSCVWLAWRSSNAGDVVVTPAPGDYIPGLAPNYIASLPNDPIGGSPSSFENPPCDTPNWHRSFLYYSDGKDYKLLLHCGPENPWTSNDPFYDHIRPNWAWAVYSPGAVDW